MDINNNIIKDSSIVILRYKEEVSKELVKLTNILVDNDNIDAAKVLLTLYYAMSIGEECKLAIMLENIRKEFRDKHNNKSKICPKYD